MKMSVSKKISGSFLIVFVLLAIISTVSVISLQKINDSYSELTERRTVILVNMKEIVNLATTQNNHMRGILLMQDYDSEKNLRAANTRINEQIEETLKIVKTEATKKQLEMIMEKNQHFKESYEEFLKYGKNLSLEEKIQYWKVKIQPAILTIGPLAEEVASESEIALEEATADNNKLVQTTTITLIILSILTLLVIMIVSFIIVRNIARPLVKITEATEKMASGNLTIESIKIKNKDELGMLAQSFNQMVSTIRHLVTEVRVSTEQVAASSEQLMASAEQTSQATNQITLSFQEVAAGAETQGAGAVESSKALHEMMTGMQKMVDSTSAVALESEETTKETNKGNESIQNVIVQMNKIHSSVNQTATVIQQLDKRSKEISNIIDAITNISDQTNLLALNAAIEAARAGEHGKGFAVVADEVRKLAEQSKLSAEQITKLVQEIQTDTRKAVSAMQLGTEDVKTGLTIVHETGDGFQHIQKSIGEVTAQIQGMSAISEEIFASLEEVSATAEEAATIAKNTASLTQNAAAASEEQLASMEEITKSATSLANMSESLLLQIKQFKV